MSEFNTFELVVDERPEGVRKLKKILGRITVIAVPIIVACVLLLVKLFALAIIPSCFWVSFCTFGSSSTSSWSTP